MNCLPRALRLGNRSILQPTLPQWTHSQIQPSTPSFSSIIQASRISTSSPSPSTPPPILRRFRPRSGAQENKQPRQFSSPPIPPPSKTEEELVKLGYLVRRTPNNGLPVYRKLKSGNTRQIIVVKRVDGDRMKLVESLVEAVGIERENIRINATTQHIELKGDYLEKTRDWLLKQGF